MTTESITLEHTENQKNSLVLYRGLPLVLDQIKSFSFNHSNVYKKMFTGTFKLRTITNIFVSSGYSGEIVNRVLEKTTRPK